MDSKQPEQPKGVEAAAKEIAGLFVGALLKVSGTQLTVDFVDGLQLELAAYLSRRLPAEDGSGIRVALQRLVDDVPRNGQCDEAWKQAENALVSETAPRTQPQPTAILQKLLEWDELYPRGRYQIVAYGDIRKSEEELDEICDAAKKFFSHKPEPQPRDERQKEVAAWCAAAFGAEHQSSVPQRGLRMLEEAIEAYQSATMGIPAEEMRAKAHALIDYVMERVAGNLAQECGGLGVTLLALCEAAGISADAEELREIERVKSKPLEHFSRRNQAKNEAGFNLEVRKPEGELKA